MGKPNTLSRNGRGRDIDAGLDAARRFFANTASTYDQCVQVWTLGLDRCWKRKILGQIPPAPTCMIDQACGTGILTLQMARRFPMCKVIGVDLHLEYLSLAARKAEALGVDNVRWLQGRAEDVVLKGQYDCITSSYLAKYADMDRLVQGAKKMLRDRGVLVVHDFTYPRKRFLSTALGFHFQIMRALGSRAFPQWKRVFHELEGFLKTSRWVSDLISSLETNGFKGIRAKPLALGFSAIVSAVRM
jgi:demethylmenaquinone methyltransferase/2-methoxy-6-polyprenyl-1,4-benzoquinol methylase